MAGQASSTASIIPATRLGKEHAGLEQPHYYWDPVIAPSGLIFYTGNLFPRWKNSVFVGALRSQMLDRLRLSGKKVIGEEPLLVYQHSRIRDVRMGPQWW